MDKLVLLLILGIVSIVLASKVKITNEDGLIHIEDEEEKVFEDMDDNPLIVKKTGGEENANISDLPKARSGFREQSGSTAEKEPLGGDLRLTEQQKEILFPDAEAAANRTKRSGTLTATRLWPNGIIPYVFTPGDFSRWDKAAVLLAMRTWEEETCIDFQEWSSRKHGANRIVLQDTPDGCWSRLGLVNMGAQEINLQDPGCRQSGTYLHELGHSIGLVHEHQMPNRDNFVRYYYVNVDPDNEDQLRLYDAAGVRTYQNRGQQYQYDLSSIMHYELNSFSIDEVSLTMAVNNPWHFQYIGRRYSNILSFGDVRIVNKLYNCSKKCRVSDFKDCYAPGFVNHKCECVTPANYYSRVCRNDPDLEAECYNMAKRGECDLENPEHHASCAKACDFCPRFLPGVSGIVTPPAKCENMYVSQQMCRQWAANGDCNKPQSQVWMHRYCRLACNACGSKFGKCPNYETNQDCDNRLRYCQSEGDTFDFIKYMCPDTCGTCGKRKQGDCRNKLADNVCEQKAANFGCEVDFYNMWRDCASTCNRCWYESGECANKHRNEAECKQWAVQNRCLGGDYQQNMLAWCPKTCGTC